MTDHPSALPAHELQRIGVLLLRHEAAAGRGRIGELEETELLGREQDEVFGYAAQMHHPERRGVQERRDEVAIAADVDAVARDAAEAERRGEAVHVDGVAGPGDRAGSERQLVGLAEHRVEAIDVAAQRGAVREQEVGHEHRLRPAEVRVRRHQRVAGAIGEVHEPRDGVGDGSLDVGNAPLQVQAKIDGDLLVAGPAGVQTAPRVADAGNQLALDERVHVLVAVVRRDEAGIVLSGPQNLIEAPIDRRGVVRRQDAGAAEAGRARAAPPHVVLEQPAIETKRRSEREELGVGIAREPA
jgi:hypothetical protein